MTPPQICPPPPDCPLYAQRVDYGPDEPLRRAILTERPRPDLAALIRAEAVPMQIDAAKGETTGHVAQPVLPLPSQTALPVPEPVPSSILDQLHQEKGSK